MRVKICGIRSEADLAVATDAGADALGFLVGLTHVSEDKLDPVEARGLIRRVPPFVQAVLVTHLVEAREIVDLAIYLGAEVVQLHGEMTDDEVRAVRELLPLATLVRAVHVTPRATVADLRTHVVAMAALVDGVLLDSRTAERLGGTGQTHDWSVSRQVVEASPVPVILAGGLTPRNVDAAVTSVRPFAVDVNSGVETSTGDKSVQKCADFVQAARSAVVASEPVSTG